MHSISYISHRLNQTLHEMCELEEGAVNELSKFKISTSVEFEITHLISALDECRLGKFFIIIVLRDDCFPKSKKSTKMRFLRSNFKKIDNNSNRKICCNHFKTIEKTFDYKRKISES